MKLGELFNIHEIVEHASEAKILVNNDPVWDYKDVDGELRLIHEPVEGSESYGDVILNELAEFKDLEVKSETKEGPVTGYELIKQGKAYKLILSI